MVTCLRTLFFATLAACGLVSAPAAADVFGTDTHAFDHNKVVSDEELSGMRGGFGLDFELILYAQLGLDTVQNVRLSMSDLAAMSAQQLADLLQPIVVQNIEDNTLISIQQTLTVDVTNFAQINDLSQMSQLQFQQSIQ